MKDFYAILAVPRNATFRQIREQYRHKAKVFHPDNQETGNAETFKQLGEAYAVLSDPAKRKLYDLQFKVREFIPKATPYTGGGTFDIIGFMQTAARARGVPQSVVDQVSPVIERKLDEHGVKARAVTAEDVLTGLGWLKPKRGRKRA